MLEQEQISKGNALRNACLERKEMCPASYISNSVENVDAAPAGLAVGALAPCQDPVHAEKTSALQPGCTLLQLQDSVGEHSSCQKLRDHEPAEHSSHPSKAAEKCDDHSSNSAKLLPSLPGTVPMRKPVDIMMHKDRINLLRQMSQVFNEEQHVVAADASSASEDEREDKDATKENVILRKKGTNICSEKSVPILDKRNDSAKLTTTCEGKKKSASNGALKPLVSNSSIEVGLFNSDALLLLEKDVPVNEPEVRNEDDFENSNTSRVEERKAKEIIPPEKSCAKANIPSKSGNLEIKQGKVYHVSSYTKRVQEKISVKSFVGKSGEQVDIIDGFSFISFEDKTALLNFKLSSTSENRKLKSGKRIKASEQLDLGHSSEKRNKVKEPSSAILAGALVADAVEADASHASLQKYKEAANEDLVITKPPSSNSTECSAFSSSRLDEFLCKNSTLNISYDVPECRKTVEGVSKVWDEDDQDTSADLKLQSFSAQTAATVNKISSHKTGKVNCISADIAPKTLPNAPILPVQSSAAPNGFLSSNISKNRSMSHAASSASPAAASASERSVKPLQSLSAEPFTSLPCKRPKVVTKPSGKADKKFLRPKSSEVFVCRGGKLVPLTSIMKRGAPPKLPEKKKTSDLIYVYHDGKFLTMGGSLCNVDPRYSRSLTSQVVLPINLINKPSQKRKSFTHSNFRAVLIDKRMADFALSALRKPIPTYKDFHKNGAFIRNGSLSCRRQGALAKVKPRTTKSSILDIISEKLAIDVGDCSSRDVSENVGSELERRDSKLVQKNLHRFPSLSREMQRLDKKYAPSDSVDAKEQGWGGGRHLPSQQQRGPQPQELPVRGSRTSGEVGVDVKRCEVKVPWYRLPPSLKVWCLVHHCYDCSCGLAAPAADSSPLKHLHQDGDVKKVTGFHQEHSFSDNRSITGLEKDWSRKGDSKGKLELDVSNDQTVLKVKPELLSPDSAFAALLNSRLTSCENKGKESLLQLGQSVEPSKNNNYTSKNAFNGYQGIFSHRVSATNMHRDCKDNESSPGDKTHLGFDTVDKKVTLPKASNEASMNYKRSPSHPERKREGSFCSQDEQTSPRSKRFKVSSPSRCPVTSNMKSTAEGLSHKRSGGCRVLVGHAKMLEKLSLLGSSFSNKKLSSPSALKTTSNQGINVLERSTDESSSLKSAKASDASDAAGCAAESTCDQEPVLPECVILELCVGQREGAAGRASGPTIHNIIKHWSHDTNHSARTCGYSRAGKTYRAVVNPQKQGFDYTPPIAPCNSNATIKSVLSAFLKRGYIRDVQNEDRTLKYEPEEANVVYCRNRNISVVENKAATPVVQILFPREGCQSPVRPLSASSCESFIAPASAPSLLPSCSSSQSSNCVTIASEESPSASSCITRPVPSSELYTIATTTCSSTNSNSNRSSGSISSGSSNSASYSVSSSSSSSSCCSSLVSPGSSGEVKLKIAWKRGHQSGEAAAVANSVSLPEMVQAEERRGELELDLSPAPPGTAMLVTEARFRKLINMNIIGVTGLNKQSRCIIAPVESSEMLAKMRLIQTQISNRLLDVGPNMRDIFFPPHQPTGTVVKPRFIMIRCDKSGSWEIVGLVQKKSSEHQADNVHFTASDIFDASSAKKAYGCEQLPLKSEITSTVGPFKKPFPSSTSVVVSLPLSSLSASFSNEPINDEIGEAGSSATQSGHKVPPPFEHETLQLSSETSVTNCRTKPLPSISSELLAPAKSSSLYSVKAPSKEQPAISFNLISFPDPIISSSKCELPSLTPSPPTSTHTFRFPVFSKTTAPNLVQNGNPSRVAETRSSSACQTTNVNSSLISSSSSISSSCEPASISGIPPVKTNMVYKVPLIRGSSLSGSARSSSVNVMSALETNVGPINGQHKDSAETSQSSLSKHSVVTGQSPLFRVTSATRKPSVKPQKRFLLLKGSGDIPRKIRDLSKKSLFSNKPVVGACTDEAHILPPTEHSLLGRHTDEVGNYEIKASEKPPFSLTLTESRPTELSSLSMTSFSPENATTSVVGASIEHNLASRKELTKPALNNGLKWAAIDLSINFKSIKLGWLKGTIQKSILAQIRATSLESYGVVTFTVRGSEEETILYARSRVLRKTTLFLLILSSSIAALDLACSLSIVDLFKNNMMSYVFRGDEGERTFYRYVDPNFLTPVEWKKEAPSPTKQLRLPLEIFRESSVSSLLLKGSVNAQGVNEQSSSKSTVSYLSTSAPGPQSISVSEPTHNEKLKEDKGSLGREELPLKIDARPETVQLLVGPDSDAESITVSSEVTDSGVPQSAVLSCHEITHFTLKKEARCAAQPSASRCSPPGMEPVPLRRCTESSLDAASTLSLAVSPPLPLRSACPVAVSAAASVARDEEQHVGSEPASLPLETQSGSAQEHELSICLAEDSVQIFPAEDENATDEVASLTVSSSQCEKERTSAMELLGERMKACVRRNSFARIRKSKVKARKGSKLLQRYSNGYQGKDAGTRAWRAESAGARVGGISTYARMRAAVARGNHKKSGKAVKLRSSNSNAGGSGAHLSGNGGERQLSEVTEGTVSDGYGSSSGGSSRTSRRGHGRGKDSTHNEMERLRRKEIGELFVELQGVLQQEKGEDLPDCKKEVWPKRMTLKMAISLLEAKREQQWVLARKEEELLQLFNANKRHLRSLLEHSQANAKDREAAEELLKMVDPPSRVKELELLEQWAAPAAKSCRPDSSDEEYVLDVEGSDSNTSEDLCTAMSTPAASPPYATFPRALSTHRSGQKLNKTSPLSDSSHMRKVFVQENGKKKKLGSFEPCKSGRGQGRMSSLAYEGTQSRDSSSDAADDVSAAAADSGGESSASDASLEAPPSLSFSTLSFSNLPSQLLSTSMCSDPLLSSSSKPSSPDRDLH